ncbi:MAG: cupredoxin family copper-binding protein [Thermomicrobiales bacterium]
MTRFRLRQRLLLTAPFAIALALLSLVNIGFGGQQVAAQGTQAVTIAGFAFSPSSLTIEAGTTVTWTNQDSATHTATADDGSFDTGNIAQGQSASVTFDTPGTFTYHCAIHPNMTATITVTEAGGAQPTQAPAAPTQAPAQLPTTGAGTTSGGGPMGNTVLIAVAGLAILLGVIAVLWQRASTARS